MEILGWRYLVGVGLEIHGWSSVDTGLEIIGWSRVETGFEILGWSRVGDTRLE